MAYSWVQVFDSTADGFYAACDTPYFLPATNVHDCQLFTKAEFVYFWGSYADYLSWGPKITLWHSATGSGPLDAMTGCLCFVCYN